ncbi:MAG: DUF1705 domain-containing protein, partial [Thalassotalea sp.]|nr:DUF1705 domain-containing protein [Thalassotalea sp.]
MKLFKQKNLAVITKFFRHFETKTLTTNQLLFITCCYIALILNLPFLLKAGSAITKLDNYNVWFLLSLPLFLLSLTLMIQSIFAFRWITKSILILTVFCSSLIFYSTMTYGIVFDYGMVQNTVETDLAEAFSYLNTYAVLFFIVFGFLPSLFICRIQLTYKPFIYELLTRLKLICLAFFTALVIGCFFYSNYAAVGRNNKSLISYVVPYKMIDSSV